MCPEGYDIAKLVNGAGDLVNWTYLPPLSTPAEILTWGPRQFIADGTATFMRGEDEITVAKYREALAVNVQYLSPTPDGD